VSTYDDNYATCSETFATLRVFTGTLSPDDFTVRMGVEPSSTQNKQVRSKGRKDIAAGWYLTSQNKVNSRDVRRHIDFLLDQVATKAEALTWIRAFGGTTDIVCYWVSASGQGGPSLWPKQMAALAMLDLEIWFDVYAGQSEGRVHLNEN
jgi:hypothetical protein